ncbi:MAG: ABC transporter substrate binding protein, partial [Motiliproteus sp.]
FGLSAEEKKRILFIDSYHQGYTWSDGVTQGVLEILADQAVNLKIHHMDTKRNRDEKFKQAAAQKAREVITEFQPDVVIACDDNAAKYLIAPYYKDSNLPIVFCGINWDAAEYGFPASNITGMIEVEMIEPLIAQLRKLALGERIGYLSIKSLSGRKVTDHYQKKFGITLDKLYFVESYSEWKQRYRQLQNEVDMLVLGNPQGMSGWDESDFIQMVQREARIPSGTTASWRTRFSLIAYIRIAEEQGRYAATTALKILDGTPASEIPVVQNKEGRLIINLGLADAQGITFNPSLVRHADIIYPYGNKRILFIDSYHQGYTWSDGLLEGIQSVLKHSGIDLKTIRLNTKLKPLESDIKAAVENALSHIEQFKPDLIIACDDNAMKYLVQPFFKDAKTPVVFCGINWDASVYGLPYKNTTGMIEVDAIELLLSQLKKYAKGDRIGILGVNRTSARKIVAFIRNQLKISIEKQYLVETFEQWQTAYSALQHETDMVLVLNFIGISNWDQKASVEHASREIKVPVGAIVPWTMQHALIGYIKSPQEQGSWAAKTALRIIDGTSPDRVPMVKNSEFELVLNGQLLKRLNLVIDKALYSRARIIE